MLHCSFIAIFICSCGRIGFEKLPVLDGDLGTESDSTRGLDTSQDADDAGCDEQDSSALELFYPDCDGDGVFSTVPINASDENGADALFDCADGENPDGGWSAAPGKDCNDDRTESPCWVDAAWKHRRMITILGNQVDGRHQHFPVVISATQDSLRGAGEGGHVAQADGGDLLFTGDDGTTKLAHEIESYDSTDGQLVAWVKVPAVSSTNDTVIYLYYGNADPDLAKQWNPAAVWDDGGANHYRGVWHLAEMGVGARKDSTDFANDCVPQNYNGAEAVSGKLAGGDSLDLFGDRLSCGRYSSLNMRQEVTVSMWIMPREPRPRKEKWGNGLWKTSYGIYLYGTSDSLTTLGVDFMIDGKRTDVWKEGTVDIAPGTWSYLVATYDGSTLSGFVNGELDYAISLSGMMDDSSDTDLTVAEPEGRDNGPLNGIIDEMRISSVKRNAGWISTCYNNQADPASFSTMGNETSR